MNDLFLLLQAGLVRPELYAQFVSLCSSAPEAVTAQIVAEQLKVVAAIASDSSIVGDIVRSFYPPLLDYFGESPRPGEPASVGATREYLTSQFAEVDTSYAEKMAKLFDHYPDLDSNLKAAAAIGYAITNGERAEKVLQDMVTTSQSEVERDMLYRGLGAFREPRLIENALNLGLSGRVSRSDARYSMIYAAENPAAKDTLWQWVMKHYDTIEKLYGGSQQFYTDADRVITICGVEHVAEVRRFFAGRRSRVGGSSVTRLLEQLRVNARLRRRLLQSQN